MSPSHAAASNGRRLDLHRKQAHLPHAPNGFHLTGHIQRPTALDSIGPHCHVSIAGHAPPYSDSSPFALKLLICLFRQDSRPSLTRGRPGADFPSATPKALFIPAQAPDLGQSADLVSERANGPPQEAG